MQKWTDIESQAGQNRVHDVWNGGKKEQNNTSNKNNC